MPPEGYYKRLLEKAMKNWEVRFIPDLFDIECNMNREYIKKSDLVPVDIDKCTKKGTIGSLMKFVKKLEMESVMEERYEDASKWRDFPESGNVYFYKSNNIWKYKTEIPTDMSF